MVIKDEEKEESFSFNISTSLNSTKVLGLVGVGKHLKLDKKFIKFPIFIEILLIILKLSIQNYYFLCKISLLIIVLLAFLYILKQ